jgi:hypothetical protein
MQTTSDQQIIDMYAALGSGKQVAKQLGLAIPTVYAALKRNHIPLVWRRGKTRASDDAIIREYQNTKSGIAVAERLKVCDRTVYEVLARHGIRTTGLEDYRNRIRKFSAAQVEEVVTRYRNGESATALAAAYDCSTWTILTALRNAQIDIRFKGRLSAVEKQRALSLYAAGRTFKQTAQELGRAEATVTRFLHKAHPETVRARHRRGVAAAAWKGGRVVHDGYVYVRADRADPLAMAMKAKSGYLSEHRLVMARALGRPLTAVETVHHIDGNRLNNAPKNLQLRHGRHGKGTVLKCADCGSRNIVTTELFKDS